MRQSGRSRKTSHIQSPIPAFPKGKEHLTTTSNTAKWNSRPLGRAWGGAYNELPPLGEGMGRGFHKQQQL